MTTSFALSAALSLVATVGFSGTTPLFDGDGSNTVQVPSPGC